MPREAEAKEVIFIQLPATAAQRVRQIAREDERSVSAVVRRMILKALAEENRPTARSKT
jgi:hypothetical protein